MNKLMKDFYKLCLKNMSKEEAKKTTKNYFEDEKREVSFIRSFDKSNIFMCPNELCEDIYAIIYCGFYKSMYVEEAYNLMEIHSFVPSDVYDIIYNNVKEKYLTKNKVNNLSRNKNRDLLMKCCLEDYKHKTQDMYKEYKYKCPASLISNIEEILKRFYYNYRIISSKKDLVTIKTTVPKDVMPRIIERAKMELLSKKYDGIPCVSIEEQKYEKWMEMMTYEYWNNLEYYYSVDGDKITKESFDRWW